MLDLTEMELYNLEDDPAETKNVIEEYPEIRDKLNTLANAARKDMGDALQGIEGKNVRLPMKDSSAN